MTTTAYPHIELDAAGVPHIAGTSVKLVELVLEYLAYHWDAGQLHREHPHLSLAQIHSALAYYYDHQQELDRDIDQRRARADSLFNQLGESSQRAKLLAARRPGP